MNKQEHERLLAEAIAMEQGKKEYELSKQEREYKLKIKEIEDAHKREVEKLRKLLDEQMEMPFAKKMEREIRKIIRKEVIDHLRVDIDEKWDPYSGRDYPDYESRVYWRTVTDDTDSDEDEDDEN